jgi:uncharacterized protein (DUF433 family)
MSWRKESPILMVNVRRRRGPAVGKGAGYQPACRAAFSVTFPECDNDPMQAFDRITWNPNQMNGQPCIRGMRLTVRRVVEAASIYPDRADLFRNYPELEPEDVRQALAFAAANLEDSAVDTPMA